MQSFCPHCGSDVTRALLDHYIAIAFGSDGFRFNCPKCNQVMQASVRISFETRRLPSPVRPGS
jgi:predicted RNA-binding Zn-ribbon protein involved in translation (DUF1610 family)